MLSNNRGPAAVIIQAETIKQAETNKTMLLEFAYDNRFERADTLAIGGHSLTATLKSLRVLRL